jgi:hypothetical protein
MDEHLFNWDVNNRIGAVFFSGHVQTVRVGVEVAFA